MNPTSDVVEGLAAVASIKSLPEGVCCISVITPPKVADAVVEEAAAFGIKHIWFQPGASSESAVKAATSHGMSVIADGSCVLVQLGVHDDE